MNANKIAKIEIEKLEMDMIKTKIYLENYN